MLPVPVPSQSPASGTSPVLPKLVVVSAAPLVKELRR